MPRTYKKITDRDHKPHTRVKEDSRSAALQLIHAGLNTTQIEKQTGVSRSQIRRYKRNLRIWDHPTAPRTKPVGRPPKDAAAKAQREARAAASVIDDVVLPSQHEPPKSPKRRIRSRTVELAAIIAENTKIVDAYLRANKLPQPSFAENGPLELLPSDALPIQKARMIIRDATDELHDLMTSPLDLLRRSHNPSTISLLHRYKIAQRVPLQGSISYTTLAQSCGVPESDLRRLLQYGMVHHRLFNDPFPGVIAHSAASRLLLNPDTDLEQTAWDEIVTPAETRTIDHLAGTLDTASMTQTHLLRRPELAAPLDRLLKGALQSPPTSEFHALLAGRAFPGIHIVDVLPSTTSSDDLLASFALAESLPNALLTIQLPPQPLPVPIPTHLSNRVSIHHQPPQADSYVLRHMTHAPDQLILSTLAQLTASLRPGARLYIPTPMLPPPLYQLPLTREKALRELDLRIFAVNGARLRTSDEWTAFLASAHQETRCRPVNVTSPYESEAGRSTADSQDDVTGVIELVVDGDM